MNPERWSPIIGLRRVVIPMLWRMPIAIALWAGLLYLVAPVLNFLTFAMSIMAMLAVLSVAPGVAIGSWLSRGTSDRAGFRSVLVTLIPMLASIATIYTGRFIAVAITPIGDWQIGLVSFAAALWASLFALKATFLDE